ncbi:MAG: HAMP domain-containing protein [Chitinophagales bacterium]|nr:HAMP domain-containing protein [Chitinophagales bacterium]
MKIKAKLNLGVGLLFALIILLAFVSIRQVTLWAQDTKNILKANYNSLEYSRIILDAMAGKMPEDQTIQLIEQNISRQEANITETGEAELTQNLRVAFQQFKSDQQDTVAVTKMQEAIHGIMKVNLDAIRLKSEIAEKTAEGAVFWLSILGTFCFLIAFVLVFNLPSNIADPIQELTERIKNIASGDYSQRVHFRSSSEFGELAGSFNTMAEKLQEYNNSNLSRLMTEKRRIETLIDNMYDPVMGLDEEKKFLFANEEALKICGLTSAQFIGKPALELSVTNDLIRSLMKEILSEKDDLPGTRPTLKIYANGRESYFEKEIHRIAITPTGEKSPRNIGYVILLRNVTAYKELDFAKTNFIATVSHEFKTPISAIKMSLQLLESEHVGPMNEEQKHLLAGIREDAERLLKITGELLVMAQVETGNIQLTLSPSDVPLIFSRAMDANRLFAEQKSIRFEVDCQADLPQVLADSDKTTWVLVNLISNAIRYSYDNATVYLSAKQLDHQVEIKVRDTGQGIPPQYVDKVFDRFFRVPGSAKEGTGLGLAISREFMEAQGGQISLTSEFGAGTTFTLLLKANT